MDRMKGTRGRTDTRKDRTPAGGRCILPTLHILFSPLVFPRNFFYYQAFNHVRSLAVQVFHGFSRR